MKKRAFEGDTEQVADSASAPPAAPRTEPAPYARTSIAILVLSWLVPLGMFVSILHYTEFDPSTQLLHRTLSVTSLALLLVGLGLAVRAIDLARKNARMRRRLAVAALILGLLTPVVWLSELVLAWELYVTRERLDAAAAEADGSAELGPALLSTDASSSPAE